MACMVRSKEIQDFSGFNIAYLHVFLHTLRPRWLAHIILYPQKNQMTKKIRPSTKMPPKTFWARPSGCSCSGSPCEVPVGRRSTDVGEISRRGAIWRMTSEGCTGRMLSRISTSTKTVPVQLKAVLRFLSFKVCDIGVGIFFDNFGKGP